MTEQTLPFNVTCRVSFKNPVYLRLGKIEAELVQSAEVIFFKTTTDDLCYKAPDAYFGFLLLSDVADEIDQIEVIQ